MDKVAGAKFKVGKITSKYLIIEILGYALSDLQKICSQLYYTSIQMRVLLIENYLTMRRILFDTHIFLELVLPLTFNYKTSRSAHKLLEKIIETKCAKAKVIDYGYYGLMMNKRGWLRVAITKETEWLLQAELKAIYSGLVYKVQRYHNGSYKGYVDRKGNKQGVGISTFDEDSETHFGEYH